MLMKWGRKNRSTFSKHGGSFLRAKRTSLIASTRHRSPINGFRILNTILFFGMLGIAGFLLFSPKYRITHIEVNGLSYVTPTEFMDFVNQQLDDQTILKIHHKNIFLTGESGLRSAIESQYLFNSLTITKHFPDTLSFEVKEKNVIFRVRSIDHEYLIDDKGLVVEQFRNFTQRPNLLQLTDQTTPEVADPNADASKKLVTFDEHDQFPLLYLIDDKAFTLAQPAFTPDQLTFVNEVIGSKTVPYGEISLISLPAANPEFVQVRMKDGWQALFNTRDTLASQLQSMKLVIEQKITKEKLIRLERIDLRLGENVYFKMR